MKFLVVFMVFSFGFSVFQLRSAKAFPSYDLIFRNSGNLSAGPVNLNVELSIPFKAYFYGNLTVKPNSTQVIAVELQGGEGGYLRIGNKSIDLDKLGVRKPLIGYIELYPFTLGFLGFRLGPRVKIRSIVVLEVEGEGPVHVLTKKLVYISKDGLVKLLKVKIGGEAENMNYVTLRVKPIHQFNLTAELFLFVKGIELTSRAFIVTKSGGIMHTLRVYKVPQPGLQQKSEAIPSKFNSSLLVLIVLTVVAVVIAAYLLLSKPKT